MKTLDPRQLSPPPTWHPLAELVAVDRFERNGTFMEITGLGAVRGDAHRVGEVNRFVRYEVAPGVRDGLTLVFFEIEERHHRREKVNVVNSMTVFEFDADSKICRLEVYLQQPR